METKLPLNWEGVLHMLLKVQFTTVFGDTGSIIADLGVVVKRHFYAKDWMLSVSSCSDTFPNRAVVI
jgi:hypothetical protein